MRALIVLFYFSLVSLPALARTADSGDASVSGSVTKTLPVGDYEIKRAASANSMSTINQRCRPTTHPASTSQVGECQATSSPPGVAGTMLLLQGLRHRLTEVGREED